MPEEGRAKPRILLVDDDANNLDLQARILSRLGYDVTVASNGEECLALRRAAPFDAIFLDVLMPGMDGIETARRLREAHPGAAHPIVALTGATDMGDFTLQGFDDVIEKPISIEGLRRALARWAPIGG